MASSSPERVSPRLGKDDESARKRAAVETYARHEAALRRTARRYSLCEDDADDALQRGLEILLQKAPSDDPRELIRWTLTVVKHEALAIRRERERVLPPSPRHNAGEEAVDWVSLLPSAADGPAETVERREAIARSREALQALKPQELRALTLLAEGYSYAEIGEITAWSRTKVNRCLAEGRERFRRLISSSEDGRRCAEMGPLISAFCDGDSAFCDGDSAFCDGEAGAEQVAALREHLRACAACRATLRAYRAAPVAAAALAPAVPLHRSLLERGQDALADLLGRLGSGRTEAAGQVASGGGAGGVGAAALAKVAAVCIGTAAGATACVAGGLVPAPLVGGEPQSPPLHRAEAAAGPPVAKAGGGATAGATEPGPAPQRRPRPEHREQPAPEPAPAPAPAEPAAEAVEPAPEPAPVEDAPPPEPAVASAPVESGGGSPAGEFGP